MSAPHGLFGKNSSPNIGRSPISSPYLLAYTFVRLARSHLYDLKNVRTQRPPRRRVWWAGVLSLCLFPATTAAQQPDDPPQEADASDEEADGSEPSAVSDGGSVKTRAAETNGPPSSEAASRVTREELNVREPRSAPDALRYEPGVFVQQTAHSQGSAYVRGRTGQQTVLLFDGVRLNNSLFRQGPNQYFFTIDSRTIDHINVIRGSASTRWGTDAIAGAINAAPVEPTLIPGTPGVWVAPQLSYRYATADGESGGRLSLDTQLGPNVAVLVGGGARTVGLLESGGVVTNPLDGELPEVPRFAEDERTQLGTGFDELTGDLRAVIQLDETKRLTLASYAYRQYNAPRTDQCAPPYAPFDECLTYDEQFRTLIYGALEGSWGWWAERSRLVLSWQEQRELYTYDRPSSEVTITGEDEVASTGISWNAQTERAGLAESADVRLRYGADFFRDRVTSNSMTTVEFLDRTFESSRGQYITGSQYGWGGLWSEFELRLWEDLVARAGGRLAYVDVWTPADPESGTAAVDRSWTPWVGNLGLEWFSTEWLSFIANADQGFRAPNLDDLTSRQRTGPGFQLENPDLEPERGVTYEVGAHIDTDLFEVDAWVFYSTLRETISRTTRDTDACPPDLAACRNTWARLQLVNLPGTAVIWGTEGSASLNLPRGFKLTSTISYAWGEGPRPLVQADNDRRIDDDRVPLSRIPPLNGTVEALWRNTNGMYVGAGFRWATLQDRLALSDVSDERIPLGGTPGFAVLDARAGWRFAPNSGFHLVAENLTDEAYRYHGSSVNGPGRGIMFEMELGL